MANTLTSNQLTLWNSRPVKFDLYSGTSCPDTVWLWSGYYVLLIWCFWNWSCWSAITLAKEVKDLIWCQIWSMIPMSSGKVECIWVPQLPFLDRAAFDVRDRAEKTYVSGHPDISRGKPYVNTFTMGLTLFLELHKWSQLRYFGIIAILCVLHWVRFNGAWAKDHW